MSAEAVAPAPAAALAFPALGKICLVTVGTTRFDSLIAALDGGAPQLIGLLQKQGIHRLVVQAGRSEASTDRLAGEAAKAGLELEVVDYVASLQTLIEASELVISHAGRRGARPSRCLLVLLRDLCGQRPDGSVPHHLWGLD